MKTANISDPEFMIHTQKLSKSFGSFAAVKNLSISIAKGEIIGFLGANGAGKTTAIRMLCGLLTPSTGTAIVAGSDVYSQSEILKTKIGYMSQRFALYDDLRIRENICFYGGIYKVKKVIALSRAKEILADFGMDMSLTSMTHSLPLGFKQRLALTCALLHDPPLLFLDEPTSGVDPKARRSFWEEINKLAENGKTIIVSTHFMDEAEYCHRVIVMNAGEVIAMGKPSDLKNEYQCNNMQELFLHLVGKHE